MEPFIGQIIMFGGNFAPRGWASCDGQLLPISQNSALFSILGTIYGGDGRTTFGLPDLRGRVPVHSGGYNSTGPGLSPLALGTKGGRETVTLTVGNLPAHSHNLITGNAPESTTANGNYLSNSEQAGALYGTTAGEGTVKGVENTGGGQSFDVRQPYLAVNFIVALEGTYPSRS